MQLAALLLTVFTLLILPLLFTLLLWLNLLKIVIYSYWPPPLAHIYLFTSLLYPLL